MHKQRIVILGATGMLGHKVFQRLREEVPGTVATTREPISTGPLRAVSLLQGADVIDGVDVTDLHALRRKLRRWSPQVVVNCVGVIKQRANAKQALPSVLINSLLPHWLADAAAEWGGRVIHFSTDCVFSGRTGGYTEDDVSDAIDLYGKSKFLGEVSAVNALTLRTSIIGRELTSHNSLLEWFLAQRGRIVRGYTRAIYSGITTNEMAKLVVRIIRQHAELAGVYQVVADPISKYELLSHIRDAYGLDVTIEPDDSFICNRSMRGERFHAATGWRAPTWPQMLHELAADSTPYDTWLRTTRLESQYVQ